MCFSHGLFPSSWLVRYPAIAGVESDQIKPNGLGGRERCFVPRPIELKDPGLGLVIDVALGDLDMFVGASEQHRIPDVVMHQVLQTYYQHPSPPYLVVGGRGVSVWLTLSAEAVLSSKRKVLA